MICFHTECQGRRECCFDRALAPAPEGEYAERHKEKEPKMSLKHKQIGNSIILSDMQEDYDNIEKAAELVKDLVTIVVKHELAKEITPIEIDLLDKAIESARKAIRRASKESHG